MINDRANPGGGALPELTEANAPDCRVRASKTERRPMRPADTNSTAWMGTRQARRRLRHSPGQRGIAKSALASKHTHERANADPDTARMRVFSHLHERGLDMAQLGRRQPALTRTDVQLPVSKARRLA
jgi:hypothetical protein